jgi:hypothetical protein
MSHEQDLHSQTAIKPRMKCLFYWCAVVIVDCVGQTYPINKGETVNSLQIFEPLSLVMCLQHP